MLRLGEFSGMSFIPDLRITLQGAVTWWIHCHDSTATCHIAGCSQLTKWMSWSCHIAGCKNSIRHIESRFSPYFILFLMQFRLWRPLYWNSTSGFHFHTTHHRSRHVILYQWYRMTCRLRYQSAKFYPNRITLSRKKWRHVDFQDGESPPSWIVGIQ